MKTTPRSWLPVSILVLFLMLACSLPGLHAPRTSAQRSAGAVETSVAATLIAMNPTQAPSPAPATRTPEPTPTETAAGAPLRVAYTDPERNLWIWTRAGGPVQLTASADVDDVRISDDGSWIAFVRRGELYDYSLWAMHSDGTGERELFSNADFKAQATAPEAIGAAPLQFEWVPGRHVLAFNTHPLFEGPGLILNDDLWTVDADSGEKHNLLPAGQGGTFVYSPDGTQIAITNSTRISLVGADGGSRRDSVLTFPQILTYSEYIYYPTPVWAPDSTFLRVAIPPQDPMASPRPPVRIWELRAAGTATEIGAAPSYLLNRVAFSPDLNRIAYLTEPVEAAEETTRELHIARFDGSDSSIYALGAVDFDGWAPDSLHFGFSIEDIDRMQVGAVGEAPAALTDAFGNATVVWIDPRRHLFLNRLPGAWDLRLGTLGEGSLQIAALPGAPNTARPSFDFAGNH